MVGRWYDNVSQLVILIFSLFTLLIDLRSGSQRKMIVPRYRLDSYVRRCFAVAGPSTWNSLPDSLHDPVTIAYW